MICLLLLQGHPGCYTFSCPAFDRFEAVLRENPEVAICRTGILWAIVPGSESEILCTFRYYLQSYGNNIKCHVKRAFMMLTIEKLQTLDYVSMILFCPLLSNDRSLHWHVIGSFLRKVLLFRQFTHCIIITDLQFLFVNTEHPIMKMHWVLRLAVLNLQALETEMVLGTCIRIWIHSISFKTEKFLCHVFLAMGRILL